MEPPLPLGEPSDARRSTVAAAAAAAGEQRQLNDGGGGGPTVAPVNVLKKANGHFGRLDDCACSNPKHTKTNQHQSYWN